MSEQNPIRVFVTHTFSESADYHRVFEYLESSPNFFYVNTSAPDELPASGGREALKETLLKQIRAAEVVIVIGAMHEENRDWIEYQMSVAQAADIPMVALEPFGGIGTLPDEVARRAEEVVGWNERIMVDAIRRQARHEQTTRWDVIEFDLS